MPCFQKLESTTTLEVRPPCTPSAESLANMSLLLSLGSDGGAYSLYTHLQQKDFSLGDAYSNAATKLSRA